MKTILAFPNEPGDETGFYDTRGFGINKEFIRIHLHELLTKGYQITQRNESGVLVLKKDESKGHRTKVR